MQPPSKKLLKIAIITQKLGTDAATSSTVISEYAASERGHKVYEFEAAAMMYREGKLLANASEYPSGKNTQIDLGKMDAILFRPNPPVDMAYLTTLFLLRTIENDVLIMNRPSTVINLPEKIFPLYLKEFTPPTLISADAAEIKKFAEKYGEIVVKPLYDYGGHGIIRLKKGGKLNLISNTPVVAQKFLQNVDKGDKRVLFIDGKVVSSVLRLPKKGSFLANNSAGGSVHKTTLTAREKKICTALTPLFKKNDIMIAGIDLIDGMLTEINITSPTGFKWAEEFSGFDAKSFLLDRIEAKCKR